MTKDDLKKRLDAMPAEEMRQILEDIVCGLFTGRAIGTSDEIYEGVCDTLEEHGLDDGGEWEPEDDD